MITEGSWTDDGTNRRDGHPSGLASRRARPTLKERTRILLLCGGEVTEPNYFRGLTQRQRNAAVKVRHNGGKDPLRLTRQAAKLRDEHRFDEVWCVVDVDEYDIGTAISEARRLDVKLAVSNPALNTGYCCTSKAARHHSRAITMSSTA